MPKPKTIKHLNCHFILMDNDLYCISHFVGSVSIGSPCFVYVMATLYQRKSVLIMLHDHVVVRSVSIGSPCVVWVMMSPKGDQCQMYSENDGFYLLQYLNDEKLKCKRQKISFFFGMTSLLVLINVLMVLQTSLKNGQIWLK